MNQDHMYFGHVNFDGSIVVFNQDGGEIQRVRYTDESIELHQIYRYENNQLFTIDDNENEDLRSDIATTR